MAATATPTSLSVALMLSFGTEEAEAFMVEPTTLAGVAPAFRPVKVGTVTAAEVTVAIVTVDGVLLFFLFELLEINTRGEGRLVFNNK